MKISVNWLKEFTDVKISIDELVKKIGAQLGEVEEVISTSEKYQDVIVAKVVSCEKHPDADKLSLCKIDDGKANKKVKRDQDGLVQVVCGAPNVRAGLTVAWLPPGAVVPSTYDAEQFKLEARKIRGQTSNGMLASGQELDINDDHSGILEIDKPAKPGDSFAKLYQLDDHIIDIENKMFTHRPDCFGLLGVAREISGIQHKQFDSPDWYLKPKDLKADAKTKLKLTVKNEIPKLAPRFMAVPMSGIKVGPSPIALQSFLKRVGLKPINNVVDVTNFAMYITGQPLHAFDYDKVAARDKSDQATIVVRKPKAKEKISLLNGKIIEPRSDAIMIASKTRLLSVAGVMGGTDTEVDENTTNIILECANFDMYSIRKTSMTHGLFTDSVTRFNKGQSPFQTVPVLSYAAGFMEKLSGAEVAGKVHDLHDGLPKVYPVEVSAAFINERLGTELSLEEIKRHLEHVEFEVKTKGKNLEIHAPLWRTDIEIPEDIVEEVGRLYGYDHLPLELPRRTITPPARNELLETKQKIREVLSAAGANEVLTYTFVHGKLMEKCGQEPKDAFKLNNALSPDLQYYRMSLLPSLLDKVNGNIRAGFGEFGIFEINPVHAKGFVGKDKLPEEDQRVAFVFAADEKTAKAKYSGAPYYQAKKYLSELVKSFGRSVVFEPATSHKPKIAISKAAIAPFELKRSAIVKTADGEFLGELGEFKTSVRKNLKLPEFVAGFELDVKALQKIANADVYSPLSRFPSTMQDISFAVSEDATYKELFDVVWGELKKAAAVHGYEYRIEPLDIYQAVKNNSAKKKHIALRLSLTHQDRTLTTEEVNKLLDQIAQQATTKLKATRL